MNERQDLRVRTKEYALRIIRLYRALPTKRDTVAQILGKQLCDQELRSQRNIAKHAAQNPMRILSARSRERCGNWKKAIYGWN